MRVEGAVGPGEAGGSAMQGAKGLRGASGAAVQPEGAVQGAVRGAVEPAWGVQGLTHGAVQPVRSVQGVVGPGEVVWGAGRGAEGLRGASGAVVQPKGAGCSAGYSDWCAATQGCSDCAMVDACRVWW